jgi:hypothetical protein
LAVTDKGGGGVAGDGSGGEVTVPAGRWGGGKLDCWAGWGAALLGGG